MRRTSAATTAVLLAVLAASSAALAQSPEIKDAAAIPAFSSGKVGPPQAPWEIVKVNDRKKLTDFDLVEDGGKVVAYLWSADRKVTLLGAEPNPFNPSTSIRFELRCYIPVTRK